jgi:hypothetical protein
MNQEIQAELAKIIEAISSNAPGAYEALVAEAQRRYMMQAIGALALVAAGLVAIRIGWKILRIEKNKEHVIFGAILMVAAGSLTSMIYFNEAIANISYYFSPTIAIINTIK